MNKLLLIIASLGISTMGLVGCKTTSHEAGAGAVKQNSSYVFTATGDGVSLDPENNHDWAKAKHAASVNARAALLEQVKGARINSQSTVADLVLESQKASSMTRGWVSRATISYEMPEYDRLGEPEMGGIVTATAKLVIDRNKLDDLAKFID
ncbi:MAG: hypothetical protein JJT75_13905 [Opitutales bacterium]|nr:hypothetical protein [Opitutales bacterium]